MIFDLYTETDSLTAVEAEMLRRRIKTKHGKDFTRFAIKAILQNPVYVVADEDAYRYFTGRLGISRSYVSRIEKRAPGKLRDALG